MSGESEALLTHYQSTAFPKPSRAGKVGRAKQRRDESIQMRDYLASHKRCEYGDCREPSVQVHHQVPRSIGGSREPSVRSEDNWLAVCLGCHMELER